MKKLELKHFIEEVVRKRLSQSGPIRLTRILPKDKRCSNCGGVADYNMNGNWVCQKCYPYNSWQTPKAAKERERRGRLWMLKQIRGISGTIKEGSSSSSGGEWVEPNGNAHDIEHQTHTEWASDYLRSSERRFSDNPKDEMLGRGWLRIRYNNVFLLIIAEYSKVLTRYQTEHVQDISENMEWLVVDGKMNPIYKPWRCKTPNCPEEVNEVTQGDIKQRLPGVSAWDIRKHPNQPTQQIPKLQMMTLDNLKALRSKTGNIIKFLEKLGRKEQNVGEEMTKAYRDYLMFNDEIKRRLRYINKPVKEDFTLGYSHGAVYDNPENGKFRDPLNDPLLTGKLTEGYRYEDFEWLGNMAGYRVSSDVYYGSIYLGVIESYEDRYVIKAIAGPHVMIDGEDLPHNEFKTKDHAAGALHRVWKLLRTGKRK